MAFLSGEPAESTQTNDFMSVELSDGTTTWNVFHADTFSELSQISSVYGLPMTAVKTVESTCERSSQAQPKGRR